MSEQLVELESSALEWLREAFEHRENPHLRNAYALCDLRTAFGRACMSPDSDKLETLIKEFKERRDFASQFPSDGGAAGAPTAPPATPNTADAASGDPIFMTWDVYWKAMCKPEELDKDQQDKVEQELVDIWQKLVDDPKIERNNAGPEGALQLHIAVESQKQPPMAATLVKAVAPTDRPGSTEGREPLHAPSAICAICLGAQTRASLQRFRGPPYGHGSACDG